MDPDSYFVTLQVVLAKGFSLLPNPRRERHSSYLLDAQNPDGGFSGREGGSDLYYTGFALRALAVLDALTPEVCQNAGRFLRGQLTGEASIIDFFSLLYSCFLVGMGGEDVLSNSPSDWRERVAAVLETFRTADGGYARAAGGASGSVYNSFLVALSYQLLDLPLPRSDSLLEFVRSRRREDGGFVEIGAMKRSGTNPTAAGVGLLQLLATQQDPALDRASREATIDFLVSMVGPDGGLRGNGRVPVSDLLSTFTGMWTLRQLGALERLDRQVIERFVLAAEQPDGGFRGGLWDEQADVEYTFYGLGCLALLADEHDSGRSHDAHQ